MKAAEFKKMFIKNYGIDIDEAYSEPNSMTESGKVERFMRRLKMLTDIYIRGFNPHFNFNILSDNRKKAYYEAIAEQGYFMLFNGDTTLMAGFDPISNNIVNFDELVRRNYSRVARGILSINGLLYSGIREGVRRNVKL